jgi:hypothetical protein
MSHFARITYDDKTQAFRIYTRHYNKSYVEKLKSLIPKEHRSWDESDYAWVVCGEYIVEACCVIREFYTVEDLSAVSKYLSDHEDSFRNFTGDADAEDTDDRDADPYSLMLRLASPKLIKKIYKLISAEAHPDRGGNDQAMGLLNECYRRIRDAEE